MTAKERFEQPFSPSPQDFERAPFIANVKFDFGLFSDDSAALIAFKQGEVIDNCVFGKTEWEDKRKWVVDFKKYGLKFRLPAQDFFKLFDA